MIIKEASNLQNPKYKSLYRQLSLKLHPDNKKTGSVKLMAELNNSAEKGDYYFKAFLQKLEEKGIVEKSGAPKKDEELKSKLDELNKEVKQKREEASKQVNRMLEYKLFESLVKQFALSIGKREKLTITTNGIYFKNSKAAIDVIITRKKLFSNQGGLYIYTQLDESLDDKVSLYLLAQAFVEKCVERFKEENNDS